MCDDKLTDSEIIKALDICSNSTNGCSHSKYTCEDCYLNGQPMCSAVLLQDAIDLINRLQAEKNGLFRENDRLKEEIGSLNKAYPCRVDVGNSCLVYARSLDDYDNLVGDISTEGIKEFAERLKKALYSDSCRLVFESDLNIFECAIDNLLKEMLGGNETESALPPSRQAATPPSMKEAMKNFKSEEE